MSNFIITITKDHALDKNLNKMIYLKATIKLNPSSKNHSLKAAVANLDKTKPFKDVNLIYINLSVYNHFVDGYAFLEPKQIGLELAEFYNYIAKLPQDNPLHKPLKGAAHALLCILLKVLLKDGHIQEETKVGLYAWGVLNDKERIGLIRYYNSIGFEVDPQIYEYQRFEEMIKEDSDEAIPMYSTVKTLLNKCFKKEVSPELQKLLNSI